MLVWFVVIGGLGLSGSPSIRRCCRRSNPLYGVRSCSGSGPAELLCSLGGVFLCATGGEALYADMGASAGPIRPAGMGFVLPSLLLSYAGPDGFAVEPGVAKGANPFFLLAPGWAVIPLVVLATAGDDHRQPGDHHRGLFHDAAGDAARLAARHESPPDLRPGSTARSMCRR